MTPFGTPEDRFWISFSREELKVFIAYDAGGVSAPHEQAIVKLRCIEALEEIASREPKLRLTLAELEIEL